MVVACQEYVMPLALTRNGRLIPLLPHTLVSSALIMASRRVISRLINASQHTACPCHGCAGSHSLQHQIAAVNQVRSMATPVQTVQKEYAFEVCILWRSFSTRCPDVLQGSCIQPEIWRWCYCRGWNGLEEHESSEGVIIDPIVTLRY